MPVQFRCSECGQLLAIGRRKIGQFVSCPKCATKLLVPEADQSVNEPPLSQTKAADLLERADFGRLMKSPSDSTMRAARLKVRAANIAPAVIAAAAEAANSAPDVDVQPFEFDVDLPVEQTMPPEPRAPIVPGKPWCKGRIDLGAVPANWWMVTGAIAVSAFLLGWFIGSGAYLDWLPGDAEERMGFPNQNTSNPVPGGS